MRTRDIPSFPGNRRIDQPPVSQPRGFPQGLDRDLTVYKEGVRWSFADGKVLINGLDINRLITHNPAEIGSWMGIAEGLTEYRKRVAREAREHDQFAKFEAVVEALLGKIMGRLKKVYDQKMSGISWNLDQGQLVLNGINIRSFLALYRLKKTDKAKKFLKMLQRHLVWILQNPHASPDYERAHDFAEEMLQEILRELDANETSRAPRRLLPARTQSV